MFEIGAISSGSEIEGPFTDASGVSSVLIVDVAVSEVDVADCVVDVADCVDVVDVADVADCVVVDVPLVRSAIVDASRVNRETFAADSESSISLERSA